MSRWVWLLAAHSGPPLAASQGNSRARTLRSLSAFCHSRRSYLVLARRAALALVSTLVCGFPSSFGEGKTQQTIEGDTS